MWSLFRRIIFLLFAFTVITFSYAANDIDSIEKLLDKEKITEAQKLLQQQIDFNKLHARDSLVNYISVFSRLSLEQKPIDQTIKETDAFVENIIQNTENHKIKIQALLSSAEFLASIGKDKEAYQRYLRADEISKNKAVPDYNERGKIHNNLATSAFRMNNMELSAQHSKMAESLIRKAPKPDYGVLFLVYNSKANVFYYAYMYDSAGYYYEKALETNRLSDRDPQKKIYSEALIHNNLAGIYNQQGQTTKAIDAMKKTIDNLNHYIENNHTNDKKEASIEFLYEGTDNLAGIYRTLGDYHRALHLLNYSYQQKQKKLPTSSTAIFKSEILLGQIYYALNDYSKARRILLSGLNKIPKDDSGYYFWQADAHYTLAVVNNACKDIIQAKTEYETADSIYKLALQGYYDNIYIDFLNNKALFLAENNELPKAVSIAKNVLEYTIKQEGSQSLQSLLNYINLAKIYQRGGDHLLSLQSSQKAISIADALIQSSSGTLLDSVRIEQRKPDAVLLHNQAKFALRKDTSSAAIEKMIAELLYTDEIVSRKQQILSNEKDIGLALHDQKAITDFVNQLYLQQYQSSRSDTILDKIIHLHESNVYRKIRNNINRQDQVKFSNVPDSIQKQEKILKENIANALKTEKNQKDNLKTYFEAEKKWNEFQQMLKKKYPRYYAARYETDDQWNLEELLKNIPDDVTVVRYLFIDKDLYAYVIDKKSQNWIALKNEGIDLKISQMNNLSTDQTKICQLSYQLYLDLWKPLEKHVKHSRVMIIPEGSLYYLSFDMLTTQSSKDFKQLQHHALLRKYAFSYHFSLLALQSARKSHQLDKGFVAFTPIFSDREKNSYKKTLDPSASGTDHEYLTLLPLPFSAKLAEKAESKFGGTTYTGVQSTKNNFIQKAGNHAIIHIGTHAISNDEYPEFTKLIFAKEPSEPDDENAVYLYDIYQHDLSSEISVLTACETGKPGFFPGEGMISMAHAFMYAGSKSILTGLWKIDEQSTAAIIEIFYKKIAEGLPKDIALQQAKIEYLRQAEGRMIAPAYWAGLVIMGDISPVDTGYSPMVKVIVFVLAFIAGCWMLWYIFRKRKSA